MPCSPNTRGRFYSIIGEHGIPAAGSLGLASSLFMVIGGVSREFFEFGADTYLIIGYDARPYLDWSRSGLLSNAGNGIKNNQLSESSNE
jgi:hypothetical protein